MNITDHTDSICHIPIHIGILLHPFEFNNHFEVKFKHALDICVNLVII